MNENVAFEIGVGTLLSWSGGNPAGKSLNNVKRGVIVTDKGNREVVILKPGLDISEFSRELFSACIAYRLNLPVPSQFLVLEPRTHTLMYACGFLDYPNLYQEFKQDNQSLEILKLFYKWHKFYEVATFDELIQNVDRHIGNILWGGGEKFVLIDHGLTFGHFVSQQNNRLLQEFLPNIVTPSKIDKEIQKCLKIASQYSPHLGDDSLQLLLKTAQEISKNIEESAKMLLTLLEDQQCCLKENLLSRLPPVPLFP